MTATGTPALIEKLLLDRSLLMATQGPKLPVALPDAKFDKPNDGKYLEVRHFPNRPARESLSSGGPFIAQGILQVLVHWPKTKGSIPSLTVAGQVEAFFAKGTRLFDDGVVLKINRVPWSSQPIEDADTQVPVSIPYQAVVAR